MTRNTVGGWTVSLSLGLFTGSWADSTPVPAGDSSGAAGDSVPPRGGQGTLKIVTTPEKAVAYMGGVKLGLTPIDTSFESGRNTLTILLNGEELVHERVNIWPNKTTTIEKQLLMPYGGVAIRTVPGCYCRVIIDGEEVGTTKGGPLTINRLEAGTRVIRVSNGKRSKEFKVNILPEQTVDLEVNFAKK